MMKVKILESKTYQLSNIENSSCMYAYITLTDIRKDAGSIAIESDYGNWSHSWGSMGGNIRDFIISTGPDYLMDKFTYGGHPDRDVFNLDKTISRIKNGIIEARKEDSIDPELARECYNEAKELEEDAPDKADLFYMHVSNNCDALFTFYDFESFPVVTERGYGLVAFMKEVLPAFKDALRAEK